MFQIVPIDAIVARFVGVRECVTIRLVTGFVGNGSILLAIIRVSMEIADQDLAVFQMFTGA